MTQYDALHAVLAQTKTLLVDFDGPICSIFAGYPAPTVAAELCALITANGFEATPAMSTEDDPLQVLRGSVDLGGEDLARVAADALREAEIVAVGSAVPTPGIRDVLATAHRTNRRVVIVSNNSTAAIDVYLNRQGLMADFDNVIGRYDGQSPHSLKPNSYLVELAMLGMGEPTSVVLLGDSVSDIVAAQAAGIRSIGYANKPGKATLLAGAGADCLVDTMTELADAL